MQGAEFHMKQNKKELLVTAYEKIKMEEKEYERIFTGVLGRGVGDWCG